MKLYYEYLETVLNWKSLLAVLIATTHLSASQLCAKSNPLDCKWLSDAYNNYKSQNLIPVTIDVVDPKYKYVSFRYRNRIRTNNILPRYAVYGDDNDQKYTHNIAYRLPFASGWKNQYGKGTFKGTGTNNSRTRSCKKYNTRTNINSYEYNTTSTKTSACKTWGGKNTRSYGPIITGDNGDPIGGKFEPNFSSWGSKRTQKFFNWGGKRSAPAAAAANRNNNVLSKMYEYRIMKRKTDEYEPPTIMAVRTSNIGKSDEKESLVNELSTQLQDLFKKFVEWSRKQPEQKKGSIYLYRKMYGINTLRSPEHLTRGAGSFYPWGGKRDAKQN